MCITHLGVEQLSSAQLRYGDYAECDLDRGFTGRRVFGYVERRAGIKEEKGRMIIINTS